MSRPPAYQRFFAELKRRRVFRVMAVYGVVGFVVLQVTELAVPALLLPEWTYRLVALLLVLGFPVAIVLAWAFELTPGGVQRTREATSEEIAEIASAPVAKRWPIGLAALAGIVLLALGAWWVFAAPEAADSTAYDSLAVLPLDMRVAGAADEETRLFADGMHDELLTRLQRIPTLRVTSRTSVEQYRGTNRNVREIADSLGVDYVVEGAVDRVGDRIRVHMQLIDARADRHVWANTYDETMTLDNLFGIRDDLTRRIGSALEAELSPEVEARVAERPTDDAEAFKLYTRGRHLWARGSRDDVEQAVELLQEAVERDPEFALAHAALARAHLRLLDYAYAPREETLPPARVAAERALQLNADLPEAHAARALIDQGEGDLVSAREGLERAVELNPSHADAHAALGELYGELGYEYRALEELRLAHDLDPLSPDIGVKLAAALGRAGRPHEFLERISTTVELHPEYEPATLPLAFGLLFLGRSDESVEVLRQFLQRNPRSIWANSILPYALMGDGQKEAALERARQAVELTPDDWPSHRTRSDLLRLSGRFEEATASAREGARLAPQHRGARAVFAERLLAAADTLGAMDQLDTAATLPNWVSLTPYLPFGVAGLMFRAGSVERAVAVMRQISRNEPESVAAHAHLARFLFLTAPWADHAPRASLEAFDAAIELSPTDAETLWWLGSTLRELGRTRESLEPFERVVADRPESFEARSRLGWELLIGQRDPETAGAEFRRALRTNPQDESSLWGLARVHARAGRFDSAYTARARASESCWGLSCEHAGQIRLAWLHALAGDDEGARELLREPESKRTHPDRYEWLPAIAAVYAELGDLDTAFEYLDRAYELRSPGLLELKVEPWFDPLRKDPRFDDLLRRLELD